MVCNGCTDNTADVARSVPGARVLELEQGSKPAALNAGDDAATLWPRLYLDADIQISAEAVLAVLDRLAQGDVLVARPDSCYDSRGASALVRSYYRARDRIPQHKLAMWGAGAYGLNEKGHERFGAFPIVTGDDLYVDTRFDADEKAVVATEPYGGKNALRRQEPARDLAPRHTEAAPSCWPTSRDAGRAYVTQAWTPRLRSCARSAVRDRRSMRRCTSRWRSPDGAVSATRTPGSETRAADRAGDTCAALRPGADGLT